MKYLRKDDPWKRIDKELTKELLAIPDKPVYIEKEERYNVLFKIFEAMEYNLAEGEVGKISAEQILSKLRGYGITSKKDLAMRLSSIGIMNRVLSNDGKYRRYYCVSREIITKAKNKLKEDLKHEKKESNNTL